MKHGSLFSGIGGFDLAADGMGWENVFHCEQNTFGQKILKYYWPNAESFTDITKTDFTPYANKIDILTGGFPCQDASNALQTGGGSKDLTEQEPDLFTTCLDQSRKLSQSLLSQKTSQTLSKSTAEEILNSSSIVWPEWGTMQSGEFATHQKLVPRTEGVGCIWLLTPTASEYKETKVFSPYYQKRLARSAGRLREQMWRLTQITDGYINPRLILWIMGFPENWISQTQLKQPVTP